jgi:hypothetical protein
MLGKQSARYSYGIIISLLLFLVVSAAGAVEYQAKISPADHFIPERSSRVQILSGLWNEQALALADIEYRPDGETELLLNFNDHPMTELIQGGGEYAVDRSSLSIQNYERYRGSGAALVLPGNGLELEAGQGSMFYPGTIWGDFTIEFWMYPAVFRDGEELLAWEGTTWMLDEPLPQSIAVVAEQGRLKWIFKDFFISLFPDPEGTPRFETGSVSLGSRTEIVPRSWSHHMLRYDSERGLLEYLINGRSEDVRYINASSSERGAPLLPYVGEASENRLSIAPAFNGFLDDFRISRTWVEEPELAVAENEPGLAVIGPVDLGDDGIRLTGFDAEYRTPGNTDLRFSMLQRDAYSPLRAGEIHDDSAWSFVTPGERADRLNPGGSGRYVYFRVEFFPDGSDRNLPMLQDLTVTYDRDPAPPAPARFQAEPGDGSVYLSWTDVVANDVRGYLLYYGDSPGSYFGDDADLGPSPVDLGRVSQAEVSGLTNGKMYYFRIASYNSYNSPDRGLYRERNISGEVFARPSRIQE